MRSLGRSRSLPGTLVMMMLGACCFAGRATAQSPVSAIEPLRTEDRSEFNQQVRALRDDLVHSLASPSAREDLVKQVHDFLRFRTSNHPLHYESDPEFRKGLDKTYGLFVKALHSFKSSHLESLDLEEFATVAFQAYRSNSASFESFVGTNNAPTDLVPQRLTTPPGGAAAPAGPQVIRRAMLTFSLIVYATDRKQWTTANQSSHFWPWCKAKAKE